MIPTTNDFMKTNAISLIYNMWYRKVPKFSDAKKLGCDLPKIQTMRPNVKILCLMMQME